MLKNLLSKTLLMATLFMGGASYAWAEPTIIGNENNTTGWWSAFSDYFTLSPNQAVDITFKNYTSKEFNWNNWLAVVTTDADRTADGYSEYVVLRADNYAWQGANNTGADSDHSWFTSLTSNYNWEKFAEEMDGATVKMTVQRKGAAVTVYADITGSSSTKYFEKFVIDCGDGTQNIRAFLTTEKGHLELTDFTYHEAYIDYIGEVDNSTAWWSAFSDYFTIEENQILTLKYKNYSLKEGNYQNWVLGVTNDVNRNDTENGYKEFVILRADNYGWGDKYNAEKLSSYYSWDYEKEETGQKFRDEMDGSTVVMTVRRQSAKCIVYADVTASSGTKYFERLEFETESATDPIRAFLTVEGGHLELLSTSITNTVKKTISDAGWATFYNASALDLTDVENLDAAYIVTGGTDGVLNTTEVANVPANTGILIEGKGDCYIPVIASSSTDVSANKLMGVLEDTPLAANGGYVLMNETQGVAFYKNNKEFTVNANTAYLPMGFDGTSARTFYTFGDNLTGINMVKGEESAVDASEIYNLLGQRVAQPTKGLYIINGKKVIVK